MPRRLTRLPKGVQRVMFSTRNMRGDYLDRVRILAMQRRAARDGEQYTVEMGVNDCLGAGLKVLEPIVAKEFAEFQKARKQRRTA